MSGKISHKIGEALRRDDFEQISISQNAKEIEILQNTCVDPHMHGSFQLLETKALHEIYKCVHSIVQGQLELRHIFVDFSEVVM